MATVVKTARATNSGIASSRLKVDMGDLYRLEDNQGALFVTANVLGSGKAAQYEIKWHTKELRPKTDVLAASATSSDVSLTVTNGSYFQTDDLIKSPTTGETMLVTGVTSNTVGVSRSWGAVAAADIANAAEIMILGPHYGENAQLRAARSVTEVAYTNNVALWRHNLEQSNTLIAIGENGGTYHGPDLTTEREDMMLTHKRDINLCCLFSEVGATGTQRSVKGLYEFIDVNGTSRTDSTSAVTFGVFMTKSETMTRYNNKRMVGIVSRQFATIVSNWALGTAGAQVQVANGADFFGLQVMDITTPHGKFRLLVDDALEGTTYKKLAFFVATDKKGGPKWKYLRNTRVLKNRQEPDQDGYEEEILTEGSIELGNPQYHYLFKNAQTAA